MYLITFQIHKFRKSVNDDGWQTTVNYCKKEFTAASICFVSSCLFCLFSMTNNFFFDVNDYDLPLNLYVISQVDDTSGFKWLFKYLCQIAALAPLTLHVSLFFPFILILMNHTCLKIDITNTLIEGLHQTADDANSTPLSHNEIDNKLKMIIEMTQQIKDWRGASISSGFAEILLSCEFHNFFVAALHELFRSYGKCFNHLANAIVCLFSSTLRVLSDGHSSDDSH